MNSTLRRVLACMRDVLCADGPTGLYAARAALASALDDALNTTCCLYCSGDHVEDNCPDVKEGDQG